MKLLLKCNDNIVIIVESRNGNVYYNDMAGKGIAKEAINYFRQLNLGLNKGDKYKEIEIDVNNVYLIDIHGDIYSIPHKNGILKTNQYSKLNNKYKS